MTVSSGDVLRVALHYTMPEQVDAYNIIGLLCTAGTATDAQVITALATWTNTMLATIVGAVENSVACAQGRVAKMIWSVSYWQVQTIIGTYIPTWSPTNANDMLPHAVAPYITLETADPRRKGKLKFCGFCEDNQDDSIIEAATATAMGNFATALRTALTPGTASLSYAVLGDDGTARLSTAALVRGVVGSQRQRKPGVGI